MVIIRMEPTGVVVVMFLQEHRVPLVVAQAVVLVVLVVLQEVVMVAIGLVAAQHGEEVEMAKQVLAGLMEIATMQMTDQIAIMQQRPILSRTVNLIRELMELVAAVAAVEAAVRKAQLVLVLEVLNLEVTEVTEVMEEELEVSGVLVVLAVVETSEHTSIIA